ncbi:oxidoreductase [Pedobacter nototheniae]|uniref:oxidoreductase n=1 Tax=Pedobacter nototheniae TaxID=2488994 RepID=UPI00292E5E2E|nr:oxidoreductase [Pedobacter nototheniae]
MKKAIIFGASGFIGSYLLTELLNNPDYEQVTVVVRKDLNLINPKLKTLIGDLNSLPELKESIIANEIYIALGTTKKNVPNEADYYKIDHDYPVLAAKLAKENGAKSVFVVTAVGANAHSNIFYIKTKGQVELDIIALDFDHTHIFRPSMLMGNRTENRPMEKVFMGIWSVINPILFGSLKKYKGINGSEVAKAMINAAKNETEKVKIYHWQEMTDLNHKKS